ncbi:MAG: cbb3-type cytochrome c oxidase subunit 3 [Melioribacteraceae bacterium]|nr:cbb3-type cytochrome c oxidase subunit 3 [Melioribacteraceae bacterium]MCO6474727.1 cbb3-type cytochrome c oxidase subunit 3 [Melioribacteraceae bacterium]MDD3557798.1 cbb3-type cytochrome c oxidase subunit 3 [Melioribacteraceae bacterium]
MLSNNLSHIEGVSIFPVISLVIFFLVFVFVIYKVIRTDKSYIKEMEQIPLNDNEEFINNTELNHETK